MLEVDWHEKKGWGKPRIVPYGNLSISPAATGLHYGIQVGDRYNLCERLLVTWRVSCSVSRV